MVSFLSKSSQSQGALDFFPNLRIWIISDIAQEQSRAPTLSYWGPEAKYKLRRFIYFIHQNIKILINLEKGTNKKFQNYYL